MGIITMMTMTEKPATVNVYNVNGRTVSIDKSLVDRFSEIVCPVNEQYLSAMIGLWEKDNKDDISLSYAIAGDMAQDIYEYTK